MVRLPMENCYSVDLGFLFFRDQVFGRFNELTFSFFAFTIHIQVGLSFDHDTAGTLNVPSVVPKLSWGSGEMSVGGFDVEVRLTIRMITRVLIFGRK